MSTTLLLLLGAGALFLAMGRKKRRAEQIGRIKRRIYKEVSLAQSAGVDFSKKYDDLTEDEIVVLESVGADAGWKQSKRSIDAGKSYAESYYGSLRRAWNAVSGVQGIGKAYNVKDADGNLVLTWIEDAAAHVAREREVEEMEKRIRKTRNAMKRRQREIDRRGTLAVQPTPVEVKVEEDAEVIEQPEDEPVAPPTPKKKRLSKNEKEHKGIDEVRRALLDRAKHMDIFLYVDGDKLVKEGGKGDYVRVDNIITARGEDRYNYLPYINYVVVVNMRNPEYGVTYYPIRAFKDRESAQMFAKHLIKRGKNAKSVFVTDVKLDAISGVSGWQDIAEFENVIYDVVQEYLDNPDGYEHATLHVYLDKNDMKYRAEMEDNLQGTEDDGIYPIENLIRDGEPDTDAISDIANSWVFLD